MRLMTCNTFGPFRAVIDVVTNFRSEVVTGKFDQTPRIELASAPWARVVFVLLARMALLSLAGETLI